MNEANIATGIPGSISKAMVDVVQERRRQVTEEGFLPKHDDARKEGELVRAAYCYTDQVMGRGWLVEVDLPKYQQTLMPGQWPFHKSWWKPKNPRRDLVVAAALLIAEIERLDRASPPAEGE